MGAMPLVHGCNRQLCNLWLLRRCHGFTSGLIDICYRTRTQGTQNVEKII